MEACIFTYLVLERHVSSVLTWLQDVYYEQGTATPRTNAIQPLPLVDSIEITGLGAWPGGGGQGQGFLEEAVLELETV